MFPNDTWNDRINSLASIRSMKNFECAQLCQTQTFDFRWEETEAKKMEMTQANVRKQL